MKEITEEWLERAYDDIETMGEIIDNPRLTNIVALHSQQAIKKSLKAVIEELEIGAIKTHNLEKLFATVDDFIQFEVDWDLVKKLDALYIDARIPQNGEYCHMENRPGRCKKILRIGNGNIRYGQEFFEVISRMRNNLQNGIY